MKYVRIPKIKPPNVKPKVCWDELPPNFVENNPIDPQQSEGTNAKRIAIIFPPRVISYFVPEIEILLPVSSDSILANTALIEFITDPASAEGSRLSNNEEMNSSITPDLV